MEKQDKTNDLHEDNNCCAVIPGTRVVLTCSGASNLGQIANAMSTRLQHCGMAKMTCLAAVAAGLPKFISNIETADDLLLIDGCKIACGKKVLENAQINKYRYYVVSDMLPALTKEHRYDQVEEEVNRLWQYFTESI